MSFRNQATWNVREEEWRLSIRPDVTVGREPRAVEERVLARARVVAAPPADRVAEAFRRLDDLARAWTEVEPHDEIRDIARRLLRVHPLRAADALQLAAAYVAAERRPATLQFVTLDDRLRLAAMKEGFIT